jgi:hypothetical protein
MGRKDDRDAEEKAAWEAGRLDDEELESQRERDEYEGGNDTAPPP